MRRFALVTSLACSVLLLTPGDAGSQTGTQPRTPLTAAQVTLLASAARTSSSAGSAVTGLGAYSQGEFTLVVSAAATDVSDTLDVFIQKSPDGGTTWTDFIHYTQVLGNGGAKTFFAGWREAGPENEEWAAQDASAAANTQRTGMIGDTLRVKFVIVDGDADASFTFKVVAVLKE